MGPFLSSGLQLETDVTTAICEIIDSPRALTVALLVKYNEWAQLFGLRCEQTNYLDTAEGNFADDYLVTSLLQKSQHAPAQTDLEVVAIQKFLTSEERCKSTSDRLYGAEHPSWFRRFRGHVAKLLGPLGADELNNVVNLAHHGSGACVGVKGDGLVSSDKFENRLTMTSTYSFFHESIAGEALAEYRKRQGWHVVDGSTFFTVLKDAEGHRGATTEPGENVKFQLGIGEHLMDRLKIFGCDLRDQSINQFLASKARDWRLATVDLKQASDSTALGLVFEGFPEKWTHLLMIARSHKCNLPVLVEKDGVQVIQTDHMGRPVRGTIGLEKLSSMGNGFTFPVETIIFLAAAWTVVPSKSRMFVSVYGDDIIVPQAYVHDLITVLSYLGYETNSKKTFLAGRFFESCGTDWFNNRDVRPFFLRQSPTSKIPYILQIANSLRLWTEKRTWGHGCDPRFKTLWLALARSVPEPWNTKVPRSLGDTGVITSLSEAKRYARLSCTVRCKDHLGGKLGWEGYSVKHVVMSPLTADTKRYGIVLHHLMRKQPFVPPDRLSWNVAKAPPTRGYLLKVLREYVACVDSKDTTGLATMGLEPRRGYLGAPMTKVSHGIPWDDRLCWSNS